LPFTPPLLLIIYGVNYGVNLLLTFLPPGYRGENIYGISILDQTIYNCLRPVYGIEGGRLLGDNETAVVHTGRRKKHRAFSMVNYSTVKMGY
jgi:hypothetical protein